MKTILLPLILRGTRELVHALSKVDFSVRIDIYMLPSDLNLNIGKTKEYNNKILVSNTGMKIGSNRDINKDHKNLTPAGPGRAEGVAHDAPKMMKSTNKPVKVHFVAQHDNPEMLTERQNDEKVTITFLIVGTGLIAYHFW